MIVVIPLVLKVVPMAVVVAVVAEGKSTYDGREVGK